MWQIYIYVCLLCVCLFVWVKVVWVLVSSKCIGTLIYQGKIIMLKTHIVIYFCFQFCVFINPEIGKNLVSCRNFKKKDVNKELNEMKMTCMIQNTHSVHLFLFPFLFSPKGIRCAKPGKHLHPVVQSSLSAT